MKKKVALFLAVCLLVTTPLTALAAKPEVNGKPSHVVTPLYLNLGDSIAYGMSAEPGQSYFELFVEYLKVGPAVNLGVPGATTGDLLMALGTKEYQRAVQRADIITISIGGNNLLKPVILAMSDLMGITPEELVTIHNDPLALNQAFQTAMVTLIPLGFDPTEDDLMVAIVDYVIAAAGPGLIEGANAFSSEWPAIYANIRQMNPHATIVPLTIINPFFHAGNDTLTGAFNSFAAPMNVIIWSVSGMENTYVIDPNPAFLANENAVAFSLDPAAPNMDIHPTTVGHGIIFSLLAPLAEERVFQPGKPAGVGKGLTSEVEELQENNAVGLPAAHGVDGEELGELVSELAQEEPGALADHVSSSAAGLPAAHEDEAGDPLSGYGFGQAVAGLAQEDPSTLAQHVRDR